MLYHLQNLTSLLSKTVCSTCEGPSALGFEPPSVQVFPSRKALRLIRHAIPRAAMNGRDKCGFCDSSRIDGVQVHT